MRRLVVCLIAICVVSPASLLACGDKFAVYGQGVRFQRAYAAEHPANILVYLKSGSKMATPENRERLLTILRMVGHKPQAVSTLEELGATAARGNYDVVLTELTSVVSANEAVAKARVRPTVVSMVFQPTREELKEIERSNSCTVGVSRRSHELLLVINDVMDQRIKGITEACQRKHA